jgi:hypothetical protein
MSPRQWLEEAQATGLHRAIAAHQNINNDGRTKTIPHWSASRVRRLLVRGTPDIR